MRKLATIRSIHKLTPIEGADRIECAYIGQWPVVVRKNNFRVGETVVFFEVDSLLPRKPWNEFLFKHEPNKDKIRLRSIKLQGQLSQGLIVKSKDVGLENHTTVGEDVTEILGVELYIAPIPLELIGEVEGSFPTDILTKTDEERYQNLGPEFFEHFQKGFVITLKMDGTSATFFKKDNKFAICNRNWQFKDTNKNSFYKIADKLNLPTSLPEGYAVQAELVGPSIQKNRSMETDLNLYVFSVIRLGETVYHNTRYGYEKMVDFCKHHALTPVVRTMECQAEVIELMNGNDRPMQEWLSKQTYFGTKNRLEGVVVRSLDYKHSFKILSNKFLLSNKE